MTKETERLFESLKQDSKCGCDCGCPTDNTFEAMAAQFGYRASNVNGAAMESFQLQVAAQNALLLKMQGDLTKSSEG